MQCKFMMRYFISKSWFRAKLCCYTHSLTTTFCLKLNDSNRDRGKCGYGAVKVEFLKQLRKMENINNEIFSDILEQSAITVLISHLNTLKHFVAVELRYSNQLNHTKLCLDVISLTLFLKSAEIPLLSKRLFLMFLVSKEHTRGLWYPHIL